MKNRTIHPIIEDQLEPNRQALNNPEEKPKTTILDLEHYDFSLPKELIAQTQLEDKTKVNLLEVNGEEILPHKAKDLINLIREGDILIVNNTKVLNARLKVKHKDNNHILTLHKPLAGSVWQAFINKSRKIDQLQPLILADGTAIVICAMGEYGEITVDFSALTNFEEYLNQYGFLPLPPYIKRENINNIEDRLQYQSIFASQPGAVACPTASLHFTSNMLEELHSKNVLIAQVTLHVGAGTFLPVRTTKIRDHKMHYEWGSVPDSTAQIIQKAKEEGRRVIAVGTTVLRILEHVASRFGRIQPYQGETNIFIYPGYKFKVIDALITNFHTPKSTLLMLVSAFAGYDNIKKAYEYAIKHNYRFFSYGDCTFLHKLKGTKND